MVEQRNLMGTWIFFFFLVNEPNNKENLLKGLPAKYCRLNFTRFKIILNVKDEVECECSRNASTLRMVDTKDREGECRRGTQTRPRTAITAALFIADERDFFVLYERRVTVE